MGFNKLKVQVAEAMVVTDPSRSPAGHHRQRRLPPSEHINREGSASPFQSWPFSPSAKSMSMQFEPLPALRYSMSSPNLQLLPAGVSSDFQTTQRRSEFKQHQHFGMYSNLSCQSSASGRKWHSLRSNTCIHVPSGPSVNEFRARSSAAAAKKGF